MGSAKMYQPLPSHLHVLLRLTWGMRWHRRHARAHRCTGPERSLICSDHPWRWKRSGVTWGNSGVTNVHQMLTTGFYDYVFFFFFSLFEGVCPLETKGRLGIEPGSTPCTAGIAQESGSGPSQVVRPVSASGRPLTGFARPGTNRPTSSSQGSARAVLRWSSQGQRLKIQQKGRWFINWASLV